MSFIESLLYPCYTIELVLCGAENKVVCKRITIIGQWALVQIAWVGGYEEATTYIGPPIGGYRSRCSRVA